MLSMIEESKAEVIVLTTALGLIQEDIAGIFDTAVDFFSRAKSPNSNNNRNFPMKTSKL